jgi:pilus assembly protein Flp/PilA
MGPASSSGLRFHALNSAYGSLDESQAKLRKIRGYPMSLMKKFLKNESGATAIEYGLIAGLIAVVIIGAVTTLGTKVAGQFNTIAGNL